MHYYRSDTSIHEQEGDVRVALGRNGTVTSACPSWRGGNKPQYLLPWIEPHPISKLWVGIRKPQSSQQCLLSIEYNSMS